MITEQFFLNELCSILYVPDLEGESRLHMQYKMLSSASTQFGEKVGRKIWMKPELQKEGSGFIVKADKW